MLLKGVGLQALGDAIEKDLKCARHFENLVQNSDDLEMLAPVELSIFCFRHLPPQLKDIPGDENERRVREILCLLPRTARLILVEDGLIHVT